MPSVNFATACNAVQNVEVATVREPFASVAPAFATVRDAFANGGNAFARLATVCDDMVDNARRTFSPQD